MIRRYVILTSDALYEGWAHDPDEMRDRFMKAYPDATGVFVFMKAINRKVS